ncbi:metal-dependent hydrolase [Halogeometricum sp. S1BR25-6]|uniref:Metal-dependent hydrolase n=1 Tax=Halogeometricum salsisoli TaxID=2950536 RepID=A0ABU2GHS3_9EURY|nr:metal-dependent hydrolase [Halogeometricum sp. S1BR25-6]MDS0299833.1 metal-dependent hydrolase [Halogeometricum sp. S1BR25-6]
MFVGHEFFAFALAGVGVRLAGGDARTALTAGFVAALCALLPDLDIAYGFATYLLAVGRGAPLSWEAFWVVANGVHRVVTHPLPVGVAATCWFAAAAAVGRVRDARADVRAVSVTAAGALAVVALLAAGAVVPAMGRVAGDASAVVAAVYLGTVCVAGLAVARRTDAPVGVLVVAAGVGFLSHPFGDVFMAAPPPLFSPFAAAPPTGRVAFAADQTLNLLGVLFVEVAAVWAGFLVCLRLTGRRLREAFAGRAVVGVGYAPAAFLLPQPTMVDAHVLGFTVVPLAVVVGATAAGWGTGTRADRAVRGLATGLATLTVAGGAYLLVYLLA